MNRNRFIQGLKGDIQFSEKERWRIIRRSLQKHSWKTKCTVAMEEFAELQQQISKQIRGYDDRIGLLEEMADAYICLEFLKSIFETQVLANAADPSFENLAASLLRETMTIMVNGTPTKVYKDEIEKQIYSQLYSGLGLKLGS